MTIIISRTNQSRVVATGFFALHDVPARGNEELGKWLNRSLLTLLKDAPFSVSPYAGHERKDEVGGGGGDGGRNETTAS